MSASPARTFRALRAGARDLAQCERGLAFVEFGMALPVLLTIGLMGLEVTNYALAHLRISNIAVLTADNASRVRDRIDEADISELFLGATQAGESIDFEQNGRIILSALEQSPADATKQWIRWQRCEGDKNVTSSYGKPRAADGTVIKNGTEAFNANGTATSKPSSHVASNMNGMGKTGKTIAAQAGTAVMVAEVVYDYQPVVSGDLLGPIEIKYLSAFNVRQRTDQILYNGGKRTPMSCG